MALPFDPRLTPGTALAFTLLLSLSGCGSARNEARILGEWRLDKSDNLANWMFDDNSDRSESTTMTAPKTLDIVVKFGKRGELETRSTVSGTLSTKRGKWKLLKADEDSMELRCTLGLDESTVHTIEFLDKNTIRMVPPNMAVLEDAYQFSRIK